MGSAGVDFSAPVTLLGDAAHPMSPFKGQGANQALLDAVQLARALRKFACAPRDSPSLPQILDSYEAEMMSRASAKVLASRTASEFLHCSAATVPANTTRAAAAAAASKRKACAEADET